jgi:RNA polymerase sigma-70 factor (ECF subfamily)
MGASGISNDDFAALYSQCHLDLLRYAMSLLPDRSQAEDVVQETARALWKKKDEFDPDQPFWPWAKKFAWFEVMRHRKKMAIRRKYFADELIEALAAER